VAGAEADALALLEYMLRYPEDRGSAEPGRPADAALASALLQEGRVEGQRESIRQLVRARFRQRAAGSARATGRDERRGHAGCVARPANAAPSAADLLCTARQRGRASRTDMTHDVSGGRRTPPRWSAVWARRRAGAMAGPGCSAI